MLAKMGAKRSNGLTKEDTDAMDSKIVKMDLTKKIVLTTNALTTSLNVRTVKSASGAIGGAMVRNIVSMDLTKKTVHTLAQLICLNVLMVWVMGTMI